MEDDENLQVTYRCDQDCGWEHTHQLGGMVPRECADCGGRVTSHSIEYMKRARVASPYGFWDAGDDVGFEVDR